MSRQPILIYDGDCNFCIRWIERWRSLTGDVLDYEPYQKVGTEYPQIPKENFQKSVQLVEEDIVYSGAEAVFRTLAYNSKRKILLWAYQNIPGVRFVTESFYRLVASNRVFFSRLTRFFWGNHLKPETFHFARWLFFKSLALIYLVAFVSIGSQVLGLVGENGISPAASYLERIAAQVDSHEKYLAVPSLFWLNSSDFMLQLLCWAGAFFAFVLFWGFLPRLTLIILWAFYLSLVTVGQEFMSFQWDILLLEVGVLAIFFAPPARHFVGQWKAPRIYLSHWLLKWLLFRLMFSSGVVKIISGDRTWHQLKALNFHYETQPLPTVLGWFAHQLPQWFDKVSVVAMFGIELVLPFLIFAPRRLRMWSCLGMVLLQVLIMLTGNYCFFNLLTIALCFLLIDDSVWPFEWVNRLRNKDIHFKRDIVVGRGLTILFAAFTLFITTAQTARLLDWKLPWRDFEYGIERQLASFRFFNRYGLFAVMTVARPEIIIEGSRNGVLWKEYEFHYKPDQLKKMPTLAQPHQPRLDWQLWFAALTNHQSNPWFRRFCQALLRGDPEVIRLVKKSPFPDATPRYIRAIIYNYHFTDWKTLRETGEWWRRDRRRMYLASQTLRR